MSTYIHYTDEQKARARQTDLAELLRSQGASLPKRRTEGRFTVNPQEQPSLRKYTAEKTKQHRRKRTSVCVSISAFLRRTTTS